MPRHSVTKTALFYFIKNDIINLNTNIKNAKKYYLS